MMNFLHRIVVNAFYLTQTMDAKQLLAECQEAKRSIHALLAIIIILINQVPTETDNAQMEDGEHLSSFTTMPLETRAELKEAKQSILDVATPTRGRLTETNNAQLLVEMEAHPSLFQQNIKIHHLLAVLLEAKLFTQDVDTPINQEPTETDNVEVEEHPSSFTTMIQEALAASIEAKPFTLDVATPIREKVIETDNAEEEAHLNSYQQNER